jgi:type II secretory pathway pseudopilin PulG
MIEIAISLAVIGFALVAIIGILPSAMQVQKENREETLIAQDASMWMDALRNGAQGFDDLTNYVMAITNYQTAYDFQGQALGKPAALGYTYSDSSMTPKFLLTNGFRIVGLLSTPKFGPGNNRDRMYSNHVVAFVRSMSGPAVEKFPQTNTSLQELAFSYRLISDVVPYTSYHLSYDPDWTNFVFYRDRPNPNPNDWIWRSNNWALARNLQPNLHDVRLTFRWPLFPNGTTGNGRQMYRTLVSGHLSATREPAFPDDRIYTNYFFQPRTYVKAP